MTGRDKGAAANSRTRTGQAWPLWLALAPAALAFAQTASAQSTNTYTNATVANINAATSCSAPLIRNFVVATSFTIADVDVGVFATHTFRGDIRITLQAPDGTRVQLVNGNTSTISGDNFNVRLDDSAAQQVNTDSATGTHSTAAPPPFANVFRPDSPLSAFMGKAGLGTWRLEICDAYPGSDDGQFRYAELALTSAPANFADLSLTKSVSNAAPATGAAITYTLQVGNAATSPGTATGVTVAEVLPAGVSYSSQSGFGSYDPSTGVWTVGTVAPGQTRTITIQAVVTAMASATVVNTAEIATSSQGDIDSTPGNGVAGEDDQASASFTVQGTRTAGVAPALTCPAGSSLFDWDARAWAAGSLSNGYAMAGIGTIGFTVSSSGNWMNDANYGGQSPSLSNAITGGIAGSQRSLHQYLDFNTRAETAVTTIVLPTAVPGAQFTIFDVDYNAGQFADRLVVTGSFAGVTVQPTLTNGTANYVVGNSATGDVLSANAAADGNVVVTFSQPVDTIVIAYGNGSAAPANPGGQAIAIFDITFCNPAAILGVTKVSALVSDPLNGTANPRAIPGAVMEYCILIQNPGSATAPNVIGTDIIPTTLTYTAGSMLSGASCAAATVAEDDNATGADESDPFGASITGNTLTATAASLGPGAGFALKFRATVN